MDAARREKKEHGTLAFPFQIYPALDGSEADDSDFIPYHLSLIHIFNEVNTPEPWLPWPLLFTGLLVNNMYYWATNQSIIQRTFGAKNLKEDVYKRQQQEDADRRGRNYCRGHPHSVQGGDHPV